MITSIWKRIFFLLPVAFLFAIPALADDNANPCALQWNAYLSAEDADKREAGETYKKCEALAEEQKKVNFTETRDRWVASLDTLPSGGWVYLAVTADGTNAFFGSRRHATREGDVVAVWLRFEYRETQIAGTIQYKSEVERQLFDCARSKSIISSVTYYTENNLGGAASNSTYDEARAVWSPTVPGSQGDFLLDWACKAVPRAQPAKTQ